MHTRSRRVDSARAEPQKDGLVAITLKCAYADGTVAVVMDPLSLLCRLAMSVPPPRYHIVKYADVLASASRLRSRIAPLPAVMAAQGDDGAALVPERRGTYRPWAELLKRTFDFDVLQCPSCGGRMKLLALVIDSSSVARYVRAFGEPTDAPHRSPSRGPPPWWKSVVPPWGWRCGRCAELQTTSRLPRSARYSDERTTLTRILRPSVTLGGSGAEYLDTPVLLRFLASKGTREAPGMR